MILDASLVPLEKALLARADYLEAEAKHEPGMTAGGELARQWLAQEFRALAEELRNQ